MNSKPTLEEWTKQISDQDMPALGRTVNAIERISESEEEPICALADIILEDAAMTTHVLRLTDSAYHIPRKNRQNTISRALVMLGLNEVKSICLSVAVLDPLLNKDSKKQLVEEMAASFHGAVQSRYLAVLKGDRATEEVFIAALLYDLGELVFWCFGGEQADLLYREMQMSDETPEEVQERVLGFKLKDLTLKLAQKWGLGKLLQDVVNETETGTRGQTVMLGRSFARAARLGWNSPEMQNVLRAIAQFTNLAPDVLEAALKKNTQDAVRVAETYGAHAASDTISGLTKQETAEDEAKVKGKKQFYQPDPLFQLKVMRDLASMIELGTTVTEVIEAILRGIHVGIGMDRVVFALLSPNRRYLRIKSSTGFSRKFFIEKFKFQLDPAAPNIFSRVIEQKKPLWVAVAERTTQEMRELIPDSISDVIGKGEFFLGPTVVDGQAIGIFYADRHESGRSLDSEAFEAFKQLSLQANITLEYLGKY